jgi:hypothetical protein
MVYSVSPIYYVTFTTAVLTASFVLFQGFNITDTVKTISLLCGFMTIFMGVYLLNFPDSNSNCHKRLANVDGAESSRSSEETQYDHTTYGVGPDGHELQRYDSRIDGEEQAHLGR